MRRVVIRQEFPLGRFHATPWRVNPYDDPYGEWPPSPWRFARAVTARWCQWARETGKDLERPEVFDELEALQSALCSSHYSFWLPPSARRGESLRQYQPAEFKWNPPSKNKPGLRGYGTSLVQDNYWCVPRGEPLWWFIDGEKWTAELVTALEACVERLTWFGRAETLTRVRVAKEEAIPEPNCILHTQRGANTVPVLVPLEHATREDVERTTDDNKAKDRTVPPGAAWHYATLPPRVAVRERQRVMRHRDDTHLVQFALGWNVAPEPRAITRLSSRFRGAVVKELLRLKTGDSNATWRNVSRDVREAVAPMVGKDARGQALRGHHRHAEFFPWGDGGSPTRLLVWRGTSPFHPQELEAILLAASRDVSWAAPGADADEWKVRLIPLDSAVPPPPGFDGQASKVWESITPYVPPRHHLRGGKVRPGESLPEQIRRELRKRELPHEVDIEPIGGPCWVSVHVPRNQAKSRTFLGDRRGQRFQLTFREPIVGPLRLGHSSTFGLGLFRPRT